MASKTKRALRSVDSCNHKALSIKARSNAWIILPWQRIILCSIKKLQVIFSFDYHPLWGSCSFYYRGSESAMAAAWCHTELRIKDSRSHILPSLFSANWERQLYPSRAEERCSTGRQRLSVSVNAPRKSTLCDLFGRLMWLLNSSSRNSCTTLGPTPHDNSSPFLPPLAFRATQGASWYSPDWITQTI